MDPDQIQNALNRDNVRNCHRYKDIDDQRSSNDHRDHPFCIRTHQFFRGNAQRQEKGQPLLLDFIGRKVQDDQQSAAQKNTKYRQNSDQKCALRSFRIALAEQIVIVCAQNPILRVAMDAMERRSEKLLPAASFTFRLLYPSFSIW